MAKTPPAPGSGAPKNADVPTKGKAGRKPLTDAEREARENETKADRFKRLAIPRVNRVLDDIKAISNLAGSAYEYDASQVAKIFDAIDATAKAARDAFTPGKTKAVGGFTL